jgi:hypothetical protein
VTALTQRELALFLGASAQARRHRELSDKALTPLLGEGRAWQLREAAGAAPFRHLVVSGAPVGAGKCRRIQYSNIHTAPFDLAAGPG